MPRACAIGIEIGHEIGNNTRYRSFEHPIAAVLFGAGPRHGTDKFRAPEVRQISENRARLSIRTSIEFPACRFVCTCR
jgi:hypothetical protein